MTTNCCIKFILLIFSVKLKKMLKFYNCFSLAFDTFFCKVTYPITNHSFYLTVYIIYTPALTTRFHKGEGDESSEAKCVDCRAKNISCPSLLFQFRVFGIYTVKT